MLKLLLTLLMATMASPMVCFASGPKDPGNPSQWKRIFPVKDCMAFHLVYYHFYDKGSSHYYISYLTNQDGKEVYKDPYITVKSISDLSAIADIIADEAGKRCKSAAIETNSNSESCNPLDNLDPEFVRLVQKAADAVGKNGDKCKELTKYIELHDKIVALDSKNPVQISGASNIGNAILKIFANTTNDKLIDHFEECGGKANSHKFIENLLLVEFHNSCVMPKPPGLMSWMEARDIASRIGQRYRNKSILSIKDDKSKIEKEALLELTRIVSLKQIKELMPTVDAEQTLTSLDSYSKLQKAKNLNELKSYIKLVYTPDVSIEIAGKSLEGLVSENMLPKLPKDWTPERKEQYIKDVLMPKAMAGFNECIEQPKRRSNYGSKATPQINLNDRKGQKAEFCKNHKSTCLATEKPGCAPSNVGINLLSMDPEVSDADIAKSCVLNGMSRVIEPIFGLTMATQVDSFKNDVQLPENLAEHFTESSWKQFQACINNHPITRKQFKENQVYRPIYENGGTNPNAFQKMGPDEFKQLYGDCSNEVERTITIDFVEVVFISNENVTNTNPSGPKVDFHGSKYPAAAVQYTQGVVKKTIDKCYEQQNSFNQGRPDFKPSPTLCTPLLEIEVARAVVEGKLAQMFKKNQLSKNKEAKKVLADFNACTSAAYQDALSAVGNPDAEPPLKDAADVKTYLVKNNGLYHCVEKAMVSTSKIIAGKEFRTAIKKQKSSLQNFKSIMAMEGDVRSVVGACFERELKKTGSWPAFKDFNAQEGIKKATEKCSKAANKYVIPRIMLKETVTQIQDIQKQGLIGGPTDVDSIIASAAEDVKTSLKLKTDPNLTGDKRLIDIFSEGLETYLAKNPKATSDDYLNYFKKLVTKRVVEKVHSKLLEKIKSNAKSRYGMDLSGLDSSLTGQCVLDLYSNMTPEKNQQPNKQSSGAINLDELTGQIVDGFWYLKKSPPPAFQQQLNKISSFCQNAKTYRNIEDVKKSGLLDFVVKAQIQQKTIAAFKKMAMDSYNDDIRKYKGTDYFQRVRPFIEKKLNDMLALIREKLENNGAFESMMFGGNGQEITSFALDNLENVTKDGSASNKKLNQMVLGQMFKDRSKYGFASRFSEIQIVNSVGMEGYKEAEGRIHASLKEHPSIPSTVLKYAKESLDKNWTVSKVHNRIFWYDLPDSTRNKLVDAIYDNAIVPTANGEKPNTSALGNKVTAHLDGWHKDGKVFKKVFSDEIERDTKARIKEEGKWEATSEALGRWFSW